MIVHANKTDGIFNFFITDIKLIQGIPQASKTLAWMVLAPLFFDLMTNYRTCRLILFVITYYLQGHRITFHHGDFDSPLSSRKHGTNIYVQCGKLVATIVMKINWKSKSEIKFWQIAHKLFWNFCLGSFCISFVWTQKRFRQLPYSFF